MFDLLHDIQVMLPELLKDQGKWLGTLYVDKEFNRLSLWRNVGPNMHLALQILDGTPTKFEICYSPNAIRLVKGIAQLTTAIDLQGQKDPTILSVSQLAAGSRVMTKDPETMQQFASIGGQAYLVKIQKANTENDHKKGGQVEQKMFEWAIKQFKAIFPE